MIRPDVSVSIDRMSQLCSRDRSRDPYFADLSFCCFLECFKIHLHNNLITSDCLCVPNRETIVTYYWPFRRVTSFITLHQCIVHESSQIRHVNRNKYNLLALLNRCFLFFPNCFDSFVCMCFYFFFVRRFVYANVYNVSREHL